MNCKSLGLCDDISKALILDPYLRITSRKVNDVRIDEKLRNLVIQINSQFLITQDVTGCTIKLANLAKEDQFKQYNLTAKDHEYLKSHFRFYLNLLVSQSNVSIELCTKYKLDNFQGATIKSNKDLAAETKITHVMGICKVIKQEDEDFFVFAKNDFSILYSTRD